MASLQQILSWFKTGLFPNEDQFRQTWLSYWHKSEKIPQSQVFGLQDSLDTLSTGMIYKEPVQNLTDLATTYPNPQKGWSVQVINEKNVDGNSLIYQWDGTQWNNTGMVGFPSDVVKHVELDGVKSDLVQLEAERIAIPSDILTNDEASVYEAITLFKIYRKEFIKLYITSVTYNHATYGDRVLLSYYDNNVLKPFYNLTTDELYDGNIHTFEVSVLGTPIIIEFQTKSNPFTKNVVYGNTAPVNYIAPINFDTTYYSIKDDVSSVQTNVNTLSNTVDKQSISIKREWADNDILQSINLLNTKELNYLNCVKSIYIEGIVSNDKSIKAALSSLVVNHSTFGNRFALCIWDANDNPVIGAQLTNVDFSKPFKYTYNGIELTVLINISDYQNLSDADKILVSNTVNNPPRIILSQKCFMSVIPDELSEQIIAIDTHVADIEKELSGNSKLNPLKYPDLNYTANELLIISSIKDIGFSNVPEGIKEDDIIIRSFSANAQVGSGNYGQQIYLANKRIYNETGNWTTASILIAPNIPCDFLEHEFYVEVESGEMAGMIIRMLVDYSIFTDIAPFNYGTNINNKISLNLNKTWYDGSINDRIVDLENKVNDLETPDIYSLPMQQKNIVFAGSSNVWGDGYLMYSYLKAPIEWLFKSTGKYNNIDSVETDSDTMLFSNVKKFLDGKVIQISGIDSSIKFKHRGSELNICQVIKRTSDFAVIGIYDGDTKITEFTNHNPTVGSDSKNFIGDGEIKKFELDRCFTFNHVLSVNGVSKIIQLNKTQNTNTVFPENVDCLVIRSLNVTGKVIHSLWFKEAPAQGANINVSYDYGEPICFVKSTVGGTENDFENESPYADGTIQYDPTNPGSVGSGVDFRLINEKAFIRYWFDTDEEREITIKIEGGNNPYFIFNFSSSVYHNVMNAGIGGFTAKAYNDASYLNRAWFNFADNFTPDFVSIGLAGNDDNLNYPRKISRVFPNLTLGELKNFPMVEAGKIEYVSGSDTYNVTKNVGIITEITSRSLKSTEIVGSGVVVGDFARVGTYTGDLRQVQTRRIETVNTEMGEITWAEPLHLNEYICLDNLQELVGQEVSIRSISQYMDNMKLLIENIKRMSPKCKVCLFQIYYVDMWNRNTAEYTYIQQWVASNFDNSVFVIDAWQYSRNYCENSYKGRVYDLEANGTDEISFTAPAHGHWEGIEVWVDNKNVYGIDCYPITGWNRTIQDKIGTDLNWIGTNSYYPRIYQTRDMVIKWKKNIPPSGTPIIIKLATRQWSGDYAHPGEGNYIDNSLGRAMIYALTQSVLN